MMRDYHKAEQHLIEEKDKLTERLHKVLEKNEIKPHMAWFNWSKNDTIVWANCNIPRQAIIDLEEEFGKIRCIYTVSRANNLFIKFEKGE